MRFRKPSRRPATLWCAIAAFCCAAIPSRANTIFSFEPVTGMAGDVNDAFDILLQNVSGTSIDIGSFSVEIAVSDSRIAFQESTTASSAPYIFAGDSFVDALNGGTSSASPPGSVLDLSDLAFAPNSGASVAANQTVSLGRVYFNVAPNAASGIVTVEFSTFPSTSLSAVNGSNVPINSFILGSIQITGDVPEPGTAALAAFVLAVFGVWHRSRNKRHP